MYGSKVLKLADLGIVATPRQLERLPALFKVCTDLCIDDAVGEDAESRTKRLVEIWDVILDAKGGGVQSQVAGYLSGSLDEMLCLRDSHYSPLLIAARRFVCDILNRVIPLFDTPISNGCYSIGVEHGIEFLAYRTDDNVCIMDEAYFGCGQLEELDEEYEGRTVTIEEPATGKRYAGTMEEVLESEHSILFVETEDNCYVIYGESASEYCFSDSAWEEFCDGHNPRT